MPPLEPITSAPDVQRVCRELARGGAFALDTEFVSERTYRPQLELVQIATRDNAWLIDAQAVPDLQDLWALVANPEVVTVVHAGEQEARFCWTATGALPAAWFDVQLASGFVGHRYPLSYAKLVRGVLHARIHQSQTRTDWSLRPLSAAQLAYAAEDVEFLLPAWEVLREGLRSREREDWLDMEIQTRLAAVGADMQEPSWWRVSGARGLRRRSLAAVRELYQWRETTAAGRNRPRKRILRDDLIVSAAQTLPRTEDGLRRLRGFERLSRADLHGVFAAVQRAVDLPEDALPQLPRSADPAPPSTRMLALLLEAVLEEVCWQLDLDPTLVGGASDLREIVRWYAAGRDAQPLPALMRGWRAGVCGAALEAALAGQVRVRVGDVTAERPLVVEGVPDRDRPLRPAGG